MRCTICTSGERGKIDRLIANGVSHRKIAGQYGLSSASICRHKKHLKDAIDYAEFQAKKDHGTSIQEALLWLHQEHINHVVLAKQHVDTIKIEDERYLPALDALNQIASRVIVGLQRSGIVALANKKADGEKSAADRLLEIAQSIMGPKHDKPE